MLEHLILFAVTGSKSYAFLNVVVIRSFPYIPAVCFLSNIKFHYKIKDLYANFLAFFA